MQAINRQTVGDKFRAYLKHPGSLVLFLLVMLAAIVTFAVLVFLIAYILVRGVPYLTPSLFSLEYNSDNVSLVPAAVNTVLMILMSLLLAVPFGIFAAIYLVEYAKKGNKMISVVRVTAETLSGIPSIVYGLFGMLFFVTALHWEFSMLSGAFTYLLADTIGRTIAAPYEISASIIMSVAGGPFFILLLRRSKKYGA